MTAGRIIGCTGGAGPVTVPAFLDAAYARQTGEPFTGQQAPDGEDEVPATLAVQHYGGEHPFPPVTIDVLLDGEERSNIRIELTDAAAAALAAALQAVAPRTSPGKEPAP